MSFVPYQVDYTVTGAGRKLGITKKKIVFKFGLANRQALSEGQTGAHCRGTEHEVVFIWSLGSGKRQVHVDSKPVHFSESGQNGWTNDRNFQLPFSMQSPGNGTLRCHLVVAPVSNAPGANKKPFDLRVNGVTYFSFCKIFELGTPRMIARPIPPGAGLPSSRDDELMASPQERKMIAQAKLESLKDLQHQRSSSQGQPYGSSYAAVQSGGGMNRNEGNLIDFGNDDAPPVTSVGSSGSNPQFRASSLTLDPALQDNPMPPQYGGAPPMQPGWGAPPPPQQQQQSYNPTPYSNYSLGPPPPGGSAAPSYVTASTAAASYGSTAPPPSAAALVPAPAAPNQWSAPAPPQPQWNTAAPAPPPAAASSHPPPFASPQSYASYGSQAPAFATPAKPPQQQQGGYPQQQGW